MFPREKLFIFSEAPSNIAEVEKKKTELNDLPHLLKEKCLLVGTFQDFLEMRRMEDWESTYKLIRFKITSIEVQIDENERSLFSDFGNITWKFRNGRWGARVNGIRWTGREDDVNFF